MNDAGETAPKEPQVEIHKSRPIRNWREFLKEYAIIVLGVATALAAEQAVESWHWHNEVGEARAAIVQEITRINRDFFARRVAFAPCVEQRLAQVETSIAALEAGQRPAEFASLRGPSGTLLSDSEWQSERASQALTHFPRAELAAMGRYYAMLVDFAPWMSAEGDAWAQFVILKNPPRGMTASDLIRLRVNLGVAQRMNQLIVLNARRGLRISAQLGIPEVQPDTTRVNAYCTMADADYQKWIMSQEIR